MASSSESQPNSPTLQSDPLLEPGSFIDPDPVAPQTVVPDTLTPDPVLPKEHSTPNTGPKSAKKGRKSGGVLVEGTIMENPSWLPDKWETRCKTRTSGATAGTVDRYYFDPTSQHRFRSKKEVDYFLKHGTKRKKSDGTPDVVQPSESPAGGKKKSASGSKSRRLTLPPNFDFDDIPESTIWKLSDPENDVWTPYVDDKPVKKAVKAEWEAVFKFFSSGNKRPM